MAYEETSAEKSARKAREEANSKKGAEALKKADYEAFGSRGDAAVKGMEEDRMDQMGTAYKKGGMLKSVKEGSGLSKLPTKVRNKMGYMKQGGKVGSASKRADGCCVKGKTKGKYL